MSGLDYRLSTMVRWN